MAPIARQPARPLPLHEILETLGDVVFGEPFDVVRASVHPLLVSIRPHELHGAGAVFAHVGQQGEWVAGGDLELSCPPIQGIGAVGQETLQERTHDRIVVLPLREGHG